MTQLHWNDAERDWEYLVHWKDQPSHEATWESYAMLVNQFLDFHLEDKVALLHGVLLGLQSPKFIKERGRRVTRGVTDTKCSEEPGDVGCGKTVVAFLACMEVIGTGYQAAFMVPTELLAIQHYEHLLGLLENMEGVENKPSVALLTGSTSSKQSRMIREGLQSGEISLVIGTQSLISEKVEFSALRIAVVDEQHRFGVVQRGKFGSKLFNNSISSKIAAEHSDGTSSGDFSMAPHVLAMSATPIPRTLALALYGEMSLTHITDLPPGRVPVKTYSILGNDEGFEKVYEVFFYKGGKVYLVYPVIEQSDQLPQLHAASEGLQSISYRFQGYNCGLLHGKMKKDEKEEALRRFRNGDIQILLSTQVIEVGVDVPDASMMVVMNAERFGIAQLHQLRGRVGRGMKKSRCILVASTTSSLSRLKVLENSSDGFHLAEVDLLLRGPGDLLGRKQSGHLPEFPIARLEVDGNILEDAHLAALCYDAYKIIGSATMLDGLYYFNESLTFPYGTNPLIPSVDNSHSGREILQNDHIDQVPEFEFKFYGRRKFNQRNQDQMDTSSQNQFEALGNEMEELGNPATISTSNLDNISESMSIVYDLDVPTAIREGVRNGTKYPIANYMSYQNLSKM
ncbi:ATP-dependent DNA helicase-like protein RECG [Cucumis melo var. makuwa]|uniref:ATP-dependent DNA helicase-like protein RECG n=1 Tax=Cucumis melo var. makuwa TaxID=1194695 RepID=A0A5D3E016_CUCMM|nr:ATP-dependent DNA helicase-like protein RECG [Cucumis melo var. makuwa]